MKRKPDVYEYKLREVFREGAISTAAFCPDLRTVSASPTLRHMGDGSGTPRLPTHCPVCKGKVIQRMPNPTHGSVIWFYCVFCKHAWKFRID